jgi:23S rRNA pseudouridine1911/1915/1917 synthase
MTDTIIVVTLHDSGERIDRALAKALPDFSRSQIQKLIREGRVTISGTEIKAGYRITDGEVVTVSLPPVESTEIVAENIPLEICYEDDDVTVINKPAGMVVHPSPGHDSGTLVNALLAYYPDLPGIGQEKRPGIVHRLDKDTSGLIIVAKNDVALRHLQLQFQERYIQKGYLALVHGRFVKSEILVDAPIGRDVKDRKRMAVIPAGSSAQAKTAQTLVALRSQSSDYSLLECSPYTGRTHQIRVHLAYINHPIVGDTVYGNKKGSPLLARQFLHANKLSFKRPSDDMLLTLNAELPDDLLAALGKIRLQY